MRFGETEVQPWPDDELGEALDQVCEVYSWDSLGFGGRPSLAQLRHRIDRGQLEVYRVLHRGQPLAVGALHPTDGEPWFDVVSPTESITIDAGVEAGMLLCNIFFERNLQRPAIYFFVTPEVAEFAEPAEALGLVRVAEPDEDDGDGAIKLMFTREAFKRSIARFAEKGFEIAE